MVSGMPVIPPLGTGLAPLLQWLIVPGTALFYVGRKVSLPRGSLPRFHHEN